MATPLNCLTMIISLPAPMTSLILVLFLAPPSPPPPPPPSRMEKLTRILAAEDRRSLTPDVRNGLADADRSVRRRAALAAGRIGDAAVVPALLPRHQDAEVEVRQMAAFAFGLLGDTTPIDALVAALKDPEPVVRGRAAEALGQIGDARAGPAVAQMVIAALPPKAPMVTVRGDDPASMTDPWLEPRLGLVALARLKDGKSAQAALLSGGKPRFDWWAATWAAMRLENAALRPVLLAGVVSTGPLSRASAPRGLAALQALARMEREEFALVLANLDPDPVWFVRAGLAAALAIAGDEASQAHLLAMLKDDDARVLPAVLDALRQARGPDAVDTLERHLDHPDFAVRAAAADALATLKVTGLSETLAAAYAKARNDVEMDARLSLVALLASQKDARALGVLREAA